MLCAVLTKLASQRGSSSQSLAWFSLLLKISHVTGAATCFSDWLQSSIFLLDLSFQINGSYKPRRRACGGWSPCAHGDKPPVPSALGPAQSWLPAHLSPSNPGAQRPEAELGRLAGQRWSPGGRLPDTQCAPSSTDPALPWNLSSLQAHLAGCWFWREETETGFPDSNSFQVLPCRLCSRGCFLFPINPKTSVAATSVKPHRRQMRLTRLRVGCCMSPTEHIL